MTLEQNLTKENFWDRMKEQYPGSCKKFCDWIDVYKMAVNWLELFNDGKAWSGGVTAAPKFHNLPHAFQFGIWHTYALQSENDEWYNEQIYDYETLQKAIEEFFAYCDSWEDGNRCEHCGMVISGCICEDKKSISTTEEFNGFM